MSDDRMDARLRAAGERWRARTADLEHDRAEPAPVEIALDQHAFAREGDPLLRRDRRSNRSRRTWWTVAASVVVVAVAGSAIGIALARHGGTDHTAAGGGGPSSLRGVWTFESRNGGAAKGGVQVRVVAQLSVDANGMLVANDGCNTMSGPVHVTSDTITVRDIATTAMACVGGPPELQAFTDAIHRLLSGTVHWTVAGDQLTLSKGDDTFYYRRFDTGGSHDPNLLPGTRWLLDTIADPGNDGSASTGADYSAISIMFTGGPGFVVSYLCVTESGEAITANDTLTLKVLQSSGVKKCPSTSGELDQRVRARLTGPLTWSIAAGQLVIQRAGVGSLTFASLPRATASTRATS